MRWVRRGIDGGALGFASLDLWAGREVVLASMRGNGYAPERASAELRADRLVVMPSVANKGHAPQFALAALQANVGNDSTLTYASPTL